MILTATIDCPHAGTILLPPILKSKEIIFLSFRANGNICHLILCNHVKIPQSSGPSETNVTLFWDIIYPLFIIRIGIYIYFYLNDHYGVHRALMEFIRW